MNNRPDIAPRFGDCGQCGLKSHKNLWTRETWTGHAWKTEPTAWRSVRAWWGGVYVYCSDRCESRAR